MITGFYGSPSPLPRQAFCLVLSAIGKIGFAQFCTFGGVHNCEHIVHSICAHLLHMVQFELVIVNPQFLTLVSFLAMPIVHIYCSVQIVQFGHSVKVQNANIKLCASTGSYL